MQYLSNTIMQNKPIPNVEDCTWLYWSVNTNKTQILIGLTKSGLINHDLEYFFKMDVCTDTDVSIHETDKHTFVLVFTKDNPVKKVFKKFSNERKVELSEKHFLCKDKGQLIDSMLNLR
jgi:hypothetical protein